MIKNKEATLAETSQRPMNAIWHELKKNKRALVGLYFIIFLVFIAVFAKWIAPYGMTTQNLKNTMQKPNLTHLFGTDDLGRDVLSRIIYGTRISLFIGVSSMFIALAVGTLFGVIAGFFGGTLDHVIMRLTDMMLSIPSILLAIALVAAFGSSLSNLILAIGVGNIPIFVRISRSAVMSVKEQQFIEAAVATGMNDFKIILKHVIPNALSPIIVQATMGVASAILSAAGLGFIGLGIEASQAEWGTMLNAGRPYIRTHAYLTIYPGIAIMLTILSFNLLGDGIRDAIDPKLRSKGGA